MTEQNFVYVDANYLKGLEEKAKKADYYKGIIDGIMMCREEPQTHEIRTDTHECVKDTHDKDEPQTYDDKKHCVFCKWVYEPNVCGRCRNMNLFVDVIEDEQSGKE